jgi:antirestriction protein ArdC
MKSEYQQEALQRARGNNSMLNYETIIRGFMAKGIPSSAIIPRENVLTYGAWQAIGRQVRKGEKGVKVVSWIKTIDKNGLEVMRPTSATVFHLSQTEVKK